MDAPGVESRTVELDSADGRRRRTESDVQYLVAGEGPPVVLRKIEEKASPFTAGMNPRNPTQPKATLRPASYQKTS